MLSVHLEDGRVDVRDVPMPERPPGFALIRLVTGGICNTDLELQRGYYGFRGTPGHEFVGEVVEADNGALVGKRVVGEINLACGACEWCRRALGRHCPHRRVLGIVNHPGAFQEFFTLPECNLLPVPDGIDSGAAVFVEPLAAALEILEQVRIPCGATISVLGDGKLGLLIAQVLRAHGYAVDHYGRHVAKLAISARAGARTHVDHAAPAAGFDWVVEATGSSAGLDSALRMVRPRGTVFLKSTVHDRSSIDWAHVIVNEISLIGSRCGRLAPALELLRLGSVEVRPMIHERFALCNAARAFQRASEKGVLKVLLDGVT
jgi:alcohol dehydrogenase